MLRYLGSLFRKNEVPPDPMKYLITGIGNMGAEYDGTRHNIGFDVVDALAQEHNTTFKNDQLGDIAEFRHRGRTFVLLKPSTYVNLSGKAVRYWLQKKKVQKKNLLVILDDMNLPLGKIRLRSKGSDGGHNGLKDINAMIGSDYARLRLGIGNAPKGRHTDFVLGRWHDEESETVTHLIGTAKDIVISFATAGIDNTMSQYNQ